MMRPNVLRIASLLAVAILGLLLVTSLLGRGENAHTALDEYECYMPGNPVPANITCDSSHNFYEDFYVRCYVEGGAHCESGQIMAVRGVIAQITFSRCNFPLAYLAAEYGHYRSVQRANRSIILHWYSVRAHMSDVGWLDNMQPVQTVTWWQLDGRAA
jgi:hypothetical protein